MSNDVKGKKDMATSSEHFGRKEFNVDSYFGRSDEKKRRKQKFSGNKNRRGKHRRDSWESKSEKKFWN